MSNRRLDKSLKKFSKKKEERLVTISGELGLPLNGQKLVEVPNRKGFVYVRLKNNTSEVIQAYNSEVSTIYGLSVLVVRQNNIYKVIGRDQDRYKDWGNIPYLPKHGGQHSFNQAFGMGADITWVYSQQFMPLLGYPSGTNGSNGIIVAPYLLRDLNGNWKYVGNTGTPDITMYRPSTPTGAVMVLVYLDTVSGNPYLLVGSGTVAPVGLTGTSDIARYIPPVTNPNWIPDTVVRLTTGTTALVWTNLYDARPFLQVVPTGTSGGGVGGSGFGFVAWDEGAFLGTGTVLNFVGDNVEASISGSVVRVFVTGSSGGGINTGTLDARYLKLDTSNDPLTGELYISPPTGTNALTANALNNDATAGTFNQLGNGGATLNTPILDLYRSVQDASNVVASETMIRVTQNNLSGTMAGSLLSYLSGATERVNINPNAQGTGTLAFIDGDYTLSSNGLLLLLKNHGTSRFYVNASGTAHSNGVSLIKEAPADGILYGRKNSGWEKVREVLVAARTYYVRTDGSDSNNGLANTAGGAFLTIQKAVDVIAGLDINGQTVTVQIADGTYTGTVVLKNVVGYTALGNLVIQGNNGTPANVHVNVTGNAFSASSLNVVWDIKDLKITSTNIAIYALNSYLRFGNLDFAAATGAHVYSDLFGKVEAISNYAVSGNSPYHWYANGSYGFVYAAGMTITFSNSPVFTTFAHCTVLGNLFVNAMTFTNGATVTGKRYQSDGNSVIFTAGGGANYLPGNAAGTTATGGQYV